MRIVVTGASGFFGSVLSDYLVEQGHEVLNVDRLPTDNTNYKSVLCDIRDVNKLRSALSDFGSIDGIVHAAAVLAHDKDNADNLWESNVDGTRNIMQVARDLKIKRVVNISSNCVFGCGFPEPVNETVNTNAIEKYGRSKLAAEAVIEEFPDVSAITFRPPTIIKAGRLGLLTILFDFVLEGRKLFLVGSGNNRYSFIAADDLANACLMALQSDKRGIYHISSDNVPTMRELYHDLSVYAGKKPRLVSLPEGLTVTTLKVLNDLNLSPLGPYHYRMLAANFVFDAKKLKTDLGWQPTRTNHEILQEAYQHYIDNYDDINNCTGRSAHKSKAKAGILNLVRMLS